MIKKEQIQNSVKAFLHSFSQVILLENMMSGLSVIAGIGIYSYEVKNYHILLIPVLANILANAIAKILSYDGEKLVSGLFGFNAVLIGLAAVTFFPNLPEAYLVALLGSFFSIPFTFVINSLCEKLHLPGFTFPFIAVTWLFLLIAPQTNLLHRSGMSDSAPAIVHGNIAWLDALTKGLGEIYLLDSVFASLCIFIAFALANWKTALKVTAAILFSTLLAVLFQADTDSSSMGLYSYNAILVVMALETFSQNKTLHAWYLAETVCALLLCVCSDYAAATMLRVFHLPVLTFPFVVTAWFILYFEQTCGKFPSSKRDGHSAKK